MIWFLSKTTIYWILVIFGIVAALIMIYAFVNLKKQYQIFMSLKTKAERRRSFVCLGLVIVIAIILSIGSLMINESEGYAESHAYANDFFRSSGFIKIIELSTSSQNPLDDPEALYYQIEDLRKHYGWPFYSMYRQEVPLEQATVIRYFIDEINFTLNTFIYFCIVLFLIFIIYKLRRRKTHIKKQFDHQALELTDKNKTIFIAMSKHVFYFRRHAVKFVLEQGLTPISQYGIFDYFVTDAVERDLVRRANNNLMRLCDEMWVFGPISDGVLAEIKLVKEYNIPVKYFKIVKSKDVQEISKEDVEFEEDLKKYSSIL